MRVAFLVLLASAVAGCSSSPPVTDPPAIADTQPATQETAQEEEEEAQVIEICVEKSSRIRRGYRPCDDVVAGYTWYFLPWEAKIPAVGKKANGGGFKGPKSAAPRAMAKGGIGSKVAITDVDDRVRVCVKKSTRVRVSNIRCDDDERGYAWYYIRIDGHVAPVGRKAEDGSFRVPYGDTYRARSKGGDGVDAAIGYEDPDAPVDEDVEEDDEYCTHTIDGECVATNKCTTTVNDVCTDDLNDYSGDTRTCGNAFPRKTLAHRC
ncbi:hypothetical protein OG589_41100 [Sphaerisporangium sp. NBC_01403]|uniref:hypothetical protein n=1 Tax=Sphaerisporangium sp. NBC_01403 TaxID=2903599 RepID=UPI00324726C6